MLKDKDIRKALIFRLTKENQGHTFRMISELGICDGASRVDIAVANGKLCGYEIKSDKDNLERLPGQIDAYNKTFDKITIIVGKRFESEILDIVPEHWGVEVAYMNRFGNISFKKVRGAKINRKVDPKALLQLLWKEELVGLLKDRGIKGLSNKNRRKLRDIAVNAISLKEIKNYTRETIKFRKGWRFDQ